jgi:hypothetical protein
MTLTPEQHDQVSTTIKLIAESMGVTYGRAKEACVSALTTLAAESPSPEFTAQQREGAVNNLLRAGPGAFCESCGHYAARHIGTRCTFHDGDPVDGPCICEGMEWLGVRMTMSSVAGPVAT